MTQEGVMNAHPMTSDSDHYLRMLALMTIRLKSNADNGVNSYTKSVSQVVEPQTRRFSGVHETKSFGHLHESS